MSKYKLIALDLDGTLTQHRTLIEEKNRKVLCELAKDHKLLMVGAGACKRIFNQLGNFPIDIFGNFGMEISYYDAEKNDVIIKEKANVIPDKESVLKRCDVLRKKYGYTEYAGESVEFHESGMITFALLGTKAKIEDKLAFDPTREKRKAFYNEVQELFPEYTVFVGGSSSFDMAPSPYCKLYAIDKYCKENGIKHEEVLYCGDDYGVGGGDHDVYESDIDFVKVDDYTKFGEYIKEYIR